MSIGIVLAMSHLVLAGAAGAQPSPRQGARQAAVVTLPQDERARRLREEWGYADAVLTGDTAYLSGIIAVPQAGEVTPEGAYNRTFDRIAERLGRIGCTWDDVVEMTTFHTDLDAQLPFIKAAMRRFIRPPYVAWTAVGVTRLAAPDGITEIKVIAKACSGQPAE